MYSKAEQPVNLANQWAGAFRQECENQFSGEADDLFCHIICALLAWMADIYEAESFIAAANGN